MGLLALIFLFSFQALSLSVQIKGAKAFRSETIRKRIAKNLSDSSITSIDSKQLEQLQYQIQAMYRKLGFSNAKITFKKSGKDLLLCSIKEGNQILVRKLQILGNQYFSDSFLKKQISDFVKKETFEPGWGDIDHKEIESLLNPSRQKTQKKESVFFEHGMMPYDRSVFFKAKEIIEEHYLDHGFLEVEIFGPKESDVERKHWVNVKFRIQEGKQTRVRQILFSGASPQIKNPPIKIGDPLNYYKVEDYRLILDEYFWNSGYPHAKVEIKINNSDILFDIHLGDRIRIRDIRISGNDLTKKQVIERRLKIKKGDWYSLKKLAESRSKILQSDLFSEVNLDLDKDILIVEVRERKRNTLDFGFGASLEDGPRLTGIWQHRNIFGQGITFRTRAQVNYPAVFYSLPVLYPTQVSDTLKEQTSNYFEGRVSTGFLYLKMLGIPFDLDSAIDLNAERDLKPNYVLNKAGTILQFFSKPFPKFIINPQLELEYANFDCPTCKDSTQNQNSRFDNGLVRQATLRLLTILDFRNNAITPTKGLALEFNTDFGFGLAESTPISYSKLLVGLSFYLPLVNQLTWVFNAKAGGIWNFAHNAYVPLFKRFYLGGTNSVRGFSDDQIFPVDATDTSKVSLGGRFMAYARNEIRFPIKGNLDGGIFLDAGELLQDLDNFSLNQLAWGTGFGIRYNTPIGPLLFDIGLRLFDGTRTNSGTFLERFGLHFSIGNSI